MDGLRVSQFSTDFLFGVNYYFNPILLNRGWNYLGLICCSGNGISSKCIALWDTVFCAVYYHYTFRYVIHMRLIMHAEHLYIIHKMHTAYKMYTKNMMLMCCWEHNCSTHMHTDWVCLDWHSTNFYFCTAYHSMQIFWMHGMPAVN